ncbi:MAG: hypothetical protein AAGJ46_05410 [Planctomycetota bacterium]
MTALLAEREKAWKDAASTARAPHAGVVCLLAVLAALANPVQAQGQSPAAAVPSEQRETEATASPAAPQASSADAAPELGRDWVRVSRDAQDEPLAMQVAVVRYTGKAAGRQVAVDLVGAVHVGDAAYYAELNKLFEQYDALLYELVAPAGTVVDPQQFQKSRGPISALQNGMSSMLKLEHQLAKVDYTKPNFVHADMTPEQFQQSMRDRGESMLSTLFRLMGQGIAVQSKEAAEGKSTDLDLLMAMFAPDRARRLKVVFAEQMADLESLLGGLGGEKGSTLITERNKAAFVVLKRELDAGKSKVGVFYGAGHLPDMDERLRNEFSLQPEQVTWIDAWDLTE